MAPEIMRHNGEEEYTEKVDCFSFGMYIYELLTLHQPFEGHESVKECILEGGRPPLARRQTLAHPPHCLDLMVLCWSQNPRDRPSASQIVSIASAPEFARMADVIPLKHSATVASAAGGPGLSGSPSAEHAGALCHELWLACTNSRIDLLLAGGGRGFSQYHSFATPNRPTAACAVNSTVWLGDHVGGILAYSAADAARLFHKSLDNEVEIRCLSHLVPLKLVACAITHGRLLLLDNEDGSVVAEIENVGEIRTMSVLGCDLWIGGDNGRLASFTLGERGVVLERRCLEHGEESPLCEESSVLSIAAEGCSVWTYAYPGCVVWQWDAQTGRPINKLDCSKLVPCSESLKSIAIEEHLSPGRCQVTGLSAAGGDLYIGTAWGCLIIADGASMRPVTVFRPYEEDVKAVIPLGTDFGEPLIATIGRGYRDLLDRYTDKEQETESINLKRDCMHAILWRADNWAVA